MLNININLTSLRRKSFLQLLDACREALVPEKQMLLRHDDLLISRLALIAWPRCPNGQTSSPLAIVCDFKVPRDASRHHHPPTQLIERSNSKPSSGEGNMPQLKRQWYSLGALSMMEQKKILRTASSKRDLRASLQDSQQQH